jgi:hypothetical protein
MIKIQHDPQGGWRFSEPLPEPFLAIKKPTPIKARKMLAPFVTDSLEGNRLQGKAGDYLIEGVIGEFYPCDRIVFLKTYDRLTFWARLRFAFKVLFTG